MDCLQAQLSSLQGSLADAERRVYESELIRRKLHNTIQVRFKAVRLAVLWKFHTIPAMELPAITPEPHVATNCSNCATAGIWTL